jgi:predicted Na+-dependent transporter
VFSGGSFFSYNSASVLCVLVVVLELLFSFRVVFSDGSFFSFSEAEKITIRKDNTEAE